MPTHAITSDPQAALDLAEHVLALDPHTGYLTSAEGNAAYDALGAAAAAETAAESFATSAVSTHAGAADPHTGYQKESEKGAASGYASLGSDSLVPQDQLGSGAQDGTKFLRDDGTWQAPTAAHPDLATHDTLGLATQAELDAHIDDTADAHDASAISILDSAADFTATDVEGALAELQADNEAHVAAADPHTGYRLESADHSHASSGAQGGTIAHSALTGLTSGDDHTQYQKESEKDAASGYAGLTSGSLIAQTQLGSGSADGTKFLRDDRTWVTPSGSGVPRQRLSILTPLVATAPWTNMPSAASFFMGTASVSKHVQKIDLTGYTQCRLLVFKTTVAGAASSKLILRYRTAFDQTVANWSDIGTSEVSVAVNVQNTFLDTGWINLAAGAKADGIFVGVVGSGGDGALDPTFGIIEAEFK